MHQNGDVLELLQQGRLDIDQSVVVQLVRKLPADTGAPSAHLVVDQLDLLLALLQHIQMHMQLVKFLTQSLVLRLLLVVV